MTNQLSHKTIFVQGIPASCNNDQLNEVFSVFGGIKDCFVVKSKNSTVENNPKQLFYGFVTFQTGEEAKNALNSDPQSYLIDDVRIKVSLARKKTPKAQKGKVAQNRKPGLEGDENEKPKSKDFVVEIAGLPSNCSEQDLTEILTKKYINFQKIEIDSKTQAAHVTLNAKQDALKLTSRLNGTSLNGVSLIKASLMLDVDSKEFRKSSKRSRLIIRNLSFGCNENDLKEVFERYGKITEVKIPTKSNGQKFGYGFIQFTHVLEATKALKAINMTLIDNRKVAVDWALPKEKFKQLSGANKPPNPEVEKEEEKSESSDEQESEEEDNSEDEEVKEDPESEEVSGSEEDSDSEEEEEGTEEDAINKTDKVPNRQPNYSSDVHEEKTVFLRNVSFDAVEEELAEEMEKFGEIKYCKIVINKVTGLSKGCAFVQFINKEDADNCVSTIGNEEQENDYKLNGRDILASIAGSREKQKQINKEKEKEKVVEKEDKRNLYLANEGLVRPGTQSAIGLSEIELNKRQKIEKAKRMKLNNPQVFVSRTRLCVHNIPRSVDEKRLREIFLDTVEDKKNGKLTEVRIMRDRSNLDAEGKGRSLGFAFINFMQHEHALKALREINNNPKIFSEVRRPIVEFSLENKLAVMQQEQRRNRQLAKNELQRKMKVTNEEGGDQPAMSRKAKRRERKKKFLERKASEQTGSQFVPQMERKSYQGSRSMTESGKKVKMPKHSGPKIRKRNKGEILEQIRISKKLNQKQTVPNFIAKEKPEKRERQLKKRKISKDLKEDREFNNFVESYKKRFKMLA